MNVQKLEQMLASKWDEIDERWYRGTSKGFYYQEWDECLKRHGAVDRNELLFDEDDPTGFCYVESPARKGNMVRILRATAEKILVLGFA